MLVASGSSANLHQRATTIIDKNTGGHVKYQRREATED